MITEVDGQRINNAMIESQQASAGQGLVLTPRGTVRRVPATTMQVKLLATHQTAAPIHEIASRALGTFFSVEGVVAFTPTPNLLYRVKGELTKERSSVWIEESESGRVVTEKLVSKP